MSQFRDLRSAASPLSAILPERGSLAYFAGVCFVAALGGLLFGFDTAVVSGANDYLEKQFHLEDYPGLRGWIVSSALVGCILGAAMGGWLADQFGRKKILVLSGLLFALSAIGCALAPQLGLLISARLIGGIGVGIASMVAPLYIAEISPRHLRGRMISFYQFAITIGVLGAYFTNSLFGRLSAAGAPGQGGGLYQWMVVDEVWRVMVGSLFVPAAAFLLLLFVVPESPRWLTKRGTEAPALAVLAKINGRRQAEQEMTEIRDTIAEEAGGIGPLFQPGTRKALAMAVFLACSGQLSGINAIIYYGPTIFAKAGFAMDSALTQQVTLGMVNVLFTILAMWQVDRMGRRPLLLVGNAGVFISLAMIGLMFATGMNGRPLVFFMCSFLACFAFSLGPLPWVFMAEIFPTRVRGLAVSIATLSLWSVNTVICLSFPTLAQKLGPWLVERGVTRWLPWIKEENLGPAGAFWVFALLVTPVFYFVLRVMPETKNRSLEELERYFLHGE